MPALGEPARALVVDGEPVDVVVEGVEPGGRDDPGLPHRAAEEVLLAPAPSISSAGPASSAPSGQPSPFERQSVTVSNDAAEICGRDAERDGGVQEPRAVEMDARARARGPRSSTRSSSSSGQTRPPATLCVFSSTSTAGRWSTTSCSAR